MLALGKKLDSILKLTKVKKAWGHVSNGKHKTLS
jgi:hypothetical protein